MQKIELDIPKGKKLVVLTLVDDKNFQIGDKAILKFDVLFTKGISSICHTKGTIVDIVHEVNENKYEVQCNGSIAILDTNYLDSIELKIRFSEGENVKVDGLIGTIAYRFIKNGKLYYNVDIPGINCYYTTTEENLEYADITDKIKTFSNACDWCIENGKENLIRKFHELRAIINNDNTCSDILAYLKLRIITLALNEGWEPEFIEGEERWCLAAIDNYEEVNVYYSEGVVSPGESRKLLFKSEELAKYALKQFKDLYKEFSGHSQEI